MLIRLVSLYSMPPVRRVPRYAPVTAQTMVLIPVQVLPRRRAKSAETAANIHDWIYSDPHSVATALVVQSRGKSVSER